MGELVRWNLKVSRDTDVAVRKLLSERGRRKGDLSRFVEESVNREVLRQTASDIRARNPDVDNVAQAVDEELGAIRGSFLG